jgi:hypothetical protein
MIVRSWSLENVHVSRVLILSEYDYGNLEMDIEQDRSIEVDSSLKHVLKSKLPCSATTSAPSAAPVASRPRPPASRNAL